MKRRPAFGSTVGVAALENLLRGLVIWSLFPAVWPCSSSIDCHLNGRCVGGACECDTPWGGENCGEMRFKPVSFPQGYGMAPNLTAWGGGAIFDGERYHAFIHVHTHGCPLACRDNARIDHAVSDTITGPYRFQDVAVAVVSKNSAPVTLHDGTYAIFHIGTGVDGPDGGVNCSSLRDRGRFPCPGRNESGHAAGLLRRGGSTIHVSKSLYGPWVPVRPNSLPACSNPAPHVHRNGTIFIVCQHYRLLRGNTVFGPWSLVADLTDVLDGRAGGVPGKWEDPFMWQDSRENWHILYHVYSTTDGTQGGPGACTNATVSGHLFSADGYVWQPSPVRPYTSQIETADGRHITVSTRERPNIFFDASGQMTHLFNAVCAAPGDVCAAHTGTGCVDCKYEQWDYNLVVPFDV